MAAASTRITRRVDPWPTARRTASARLRDPRRAWPLALGVFYSWWALVLVFGFLLMLFVHELGHYLAARSTGMKVTEFFLGFGPRIWSFRRGETEYGLKVIPLGAYVRIIGMNNLEDVDPADEPRTFRAKGYLSRVCGGRGRRGHELRAGHRAALRGHGRLRHAEGEPVGGERRVGQQPGGAGPAPAR